tara:strand:- start:193 stop:378 length:186 start_codon:yes stop_codon:yes gene_type:complete
MPLEIWFEMEDEKLSICCTANHDERFTYDEDTDIGVCVHCKEWSKFITEEESDNFDVINLK